MIIDLTPGNILIFNDTEWVYTVLKEDNRNVLGMWQASSRFVDNPKVVKTLLFVKKVVIGSPIEKHHRYTFLYKGILIETDFFGDSDTYFLKKWEIVC